MSRNPFVAILGLALLAHAPAAAGGKGPNVPAVASKTSVEVREYAQPDVMSWTKSLTIHAPEKLTFRYSTSMPGALTGAWRVTPYAAVGPGVAPPVPLASGPLGAVPKPGFASTFEIDFGTFLPAPPPASPHLYWVSVAVKGAQGKHLDSGSMSIKYVKSSQKPVQFTEDLHSVLTTVRNQFGVPALGGATVTNAGIEELGVVGIRKHGGNVAVTTADRWHLGSDTKAMTATLLAVLVQKGVTSWSTKVSAVFPEWAGTMDARFHLVSFEHLMAHRTGIVDVADAESQALADPSKSVTARRKEFTRLLLHRPSGLLFNAPAASVGTVYSYQNANFIIAGAMMERLTGKSWEALMQAEIFDPLGMASAGFGAPGSANGVTEPWGHSDATGQRVPNWGDNTPALGPAGTVHANLADWARFIRLHLDGKEGALTLQPTVLNRLHQAFAASGNFATPETYGWGWIMWNDGAHGPGVGHDGSNTSWYCRCQVLPQAGVGFLAVSNIGGERKSGPDFGKGDKACGKVVERLRERHFK